MKAVLFLSRLHVRAGRLFSSERGASLVEYAFLVALIAMVCIAAVTLLGEETSSKFDSMADSLASS